MQLHEVLQEHVVLSLCVHLSCYAHQVALIDLKKRVLRENLFHRSHGNGTFHLQQQTHLACYQVTLIDHRLVLGLVGLVGRTLRVELLLVTVQQLYLLAVDQL